MLAYPHHYLATARGGPGGMIGLGAAGLPDLETAPPPEFDGPGGVWSPETLLVGAIADCFILTFRGVARAQHIAWAALECTVDGTLERVDGVTRFTHFRTRVALTLASGAAASDARGALERAERLCLVANSLKAERSLEIAISPASP